MFWNESGKVAFVCISIEHLITFEIQLAISVQFYYEVKAFKQDIQTLVVRVMILIHI